MPKGIGTCGHQVRGRWEPVSVADRKKGKHVATKMLLCAECEQAYRKQDLILSGADEVSAWNGLDHLPMFESSTVQRRTPLDIGALHKEVSSWRKAGKMLGINGTTLRRYYKGDPVINKRHREILGLE